MLTEKSIQMAISGQTDVAVVIPVFNCKGYLREAVDSVLGQLYQRISIVLVDDGSTDGSGQLCDEIAWKSKRVSVLHQKNAGVSAARNAGIEYILAQSDSNDNKQYIAFLDADDCWTENFFNDNIVHLLQHGYDLIGFQSCNCDAILSPYDAPNSMKAGLHSGGQSSVWLHSEQHFAAMLYACNFLRRNNIIFFEEMKYSEDKIFSMQCMYLANTIYLTNILMYLYRHNGKSAMSRRQYGIQYYVPIIDGYIRLDSLMRQCSNTRMLLSEARVMASIYIMDMIDEHYHILRSKKELDMLFATHSHYISIVEATGEYSDLKPNPAYTKYKKHPVSYIIRNNMIGGIKICKKIVQKIYRKIK